MARTLHSLNGTNKPWGFKIQGLLLNGVAPILSGILLFLAFPDHDLPWLAWIGLVPLLVVLQRVRPALAFLMSGLAGCVYFAGFFDWILEVASYKLLHHAFFDVYLGAFFAVFGLVFSFVSRRWGVTSALFAAPFMWVSLEYLRSNLSFLAVPMGLLAHSQYLYTKIIAIASVSGAYGVSFLIVLVNSAIAALVLLLLSRLRHGKSSFHPGLSARGLIALVGTTAVLTLVAISYGELELSKPLTGKQIKLSVVQGNIDQSKKWDSRYAKYIMQTYGDLTFAGAKDRPALIVWPEAATPRAITRDPGLFSQVRHIAKRAGTCLLLGSSSHQKFRVGHGQVPKFYNSAFLINPENRLINQRYHKIRLLPFGEYLPLKGTIPWSWISVPNIGSYAPGTEYTVLECPDFRFAVTICWETVFPTLVREFAKKGAQFIVNITNEAWFGKTAAPYQSISMSAFRAVENRLFVVRCANTGVSCFIDPYGRIVNRIKDETGHDLFVRGVLTERVILLDSRTIYTRYGDWFVWLSILGSVAFLGIAAFRRTCHG